MADQEFIAACGHKTTAKKLGQICPECFLNTHAELADLRAQLAARDAEVRRLREAIERAPCHDFCREAKARHYIPYTEHHHACWKVEALRLEGQDYMRPALQGEG